MSNEEFTRAIRAGEDRDFSRLVIEGDVDLVSVDYPHRLVARDTIFRGRFLASEARFARSVDLAGCTFEQNLDLSGTHVDGRLILRSATIRRGQLGQEYSDFERVTTTGNLDARLLHAEPPLIFRGARVAGDTLFVGVQVENEINLENSELDGDLLVCATSADWGDGPFESAVLCRGEEDRRANVSGPVSLVGARVEGQVVLSGAKFGGGLILQAIEVGGSVFCRTVRGNRAEVEGRVWLHSAKVAGSLEFDGAKFGGELNLQTAEIGGSVSCRAAGEHRAEVGGRVWLRSARVAGNVEFDGAKLGGELNLESAEVGGSVSCGAAVKYRAEVGGRVWLSGAKVRGDVRFNGAKLVDLVLQLTEVVGSVTCRPDGGYRTEVVGWVWLRSAKVAGDVDLEQAKLGDLKLQAAEVGGTVCCWDRVGVHAFEMSRVADFERCRIGHLVLDGRACAGGVLNLAQAHFTELEIVEALPDRVDTEGLQFQQITLPGDDYLGFLESAQPFRKSTYAVLERWLRDRGDDRRADQVYRHMRRRDRRIGLGRFARLGDWFLDVTIAYGTRSHRLFVYFVVVIGLSTWLFSAPRAVERDVVVTVQDVRQGRVAAPPVAPGPGDWSPIRAFWLSLQMNIPLVSIMSSDTWEPSSGRVELGPWELPEHLTYENYAAAVSALGWVLFPLFLAGISGIVKKQP